MAKDKVFPPSPSSVIISGEGGVGGRGELWYIIFILFSLCFHKFSSLSLALLTHNRSGFLFLAFSKKEKQRKCEKKRESGEKNIM
jgi:hypothetical protein